MNSILFFLSRSSKPNSNRRTQNAKQEKLVSVEARGIIFQTLSLKKSGMQFL